MAEFFKTKVMLKIIFIQGFNLFAKLIDILFTFFELGANYLYSKMVSFDDVEI